MKNIITALSFLLAGAFALGLGGCGGSDSSTGNIYANAAYSSSSWADVAVAAGNQTVTLSWTDNANTSNSTAITYNIYWSSDSAVFSKKTWNKIANVTSPYVHSGLKNDGTTYYYVITEVSPSGAESVESKEVSATPQAANPAPPVSVMIQAGDGQITLNLWDSSGNPITTPPNGTTYNIYWNTSGNVTTSDNKISNVTTIAKSTGFTHSGLSNGTTYYYIVTAQTASGESNPGNQVSATPRSASELAGVNAKTVSFDNLSTVTVGKAPCPSATSAYAGNQQVTIAWTAPTDSIVYFTSKDGSTTISTSNNTKRQYNIHWSSSSESGDHIIPYTGATLSFIHSALKNNETYSYYITTLDITDKSNLPDIPQYLTQFESAKLLTISVIPTAYAPPAPYSLAAAAGNQQVDLSWRMDTSGGTVTYTIHWTTNPNSISESTIPGITSKSYSHTGLSSGVTYYYYVTATSQDGQQSADSSVVSATP